MGLGSAGSRLGETGPAAHQDGVAALEHIADHADVPAGGRAPVSQEGCCR